MRFLIFVLFCTLQKHFDISKVPNVNEVNTRPA